MAEVAPRPWQVQAMEAREKEKIVSSVRKKLTDLTQATMHSSGMSEAERAKAKEEVSVLAREYVRLCSEIKTPDYSGMTEDERAAEAERLRQEALEEARRMKLKGDPRKGLAEERRARLLDFDPKQGGEYYNRYSTVDLVTFNLDEESPFGPMRFTREVYENGKKPMLCDSVNILSIKIACSDVGFPILIYGSVLVRDSIDKKCVYLFRQDRDHCQLVTSKDETLILTGPKRGLALVDDIYIETDLKIKDHQGQDRELSKGITSMRGRRSLKKCEVDNVDLATRLSTVDVMYAAVAYAVEGTIAIRVLRGNFHGMITAHTTSVQERILLYDSKIAGAQSCDGHGVIQLMRSVVSVYVRDKLIIDAETTDGESACVKLTPRVSSGERVVIPIGSLKVRVKVAWSIIDL